ncbi:MAG TPA: hypothetical protein VGP72_25745 [Planctomycetota bacterium]|jgi:hypothetical protein
MATADEYSEKLEEAKHAFCYCNESVPVQQLDGKQKVLSEGSLCRCSAEILEQKFPKRIRIKR